MSQCVTGGEGPSRRRGRIFLKEGCRRVSSDVDNISLDENYRDVKKEKKDHQEGGERSLKEDHQERGEGSS